MNTLSRPASINRRSCQRRQPRHTVRVECRKGLLGLGTNVAEKVVDVSQGGLCFVATLELQNGLDLEVLITGHGIRQIKRGALVRWSCPIADHRHMIGVQFHPRLSFAEVQSLARP